MFERVHQLPTSRSRTARLYDDLRQDLHYAARQLRRAPAFAALVIATLAIGIGANATMVGVIDRLLFRAPPEVSDPESLVRLVYHGYRADRSRYFGVGVDYPTYLDFKGNVPALSNIAASMSAGPLAFVTADPSAEVLVSMVTPNFFETLGARPAIGKFFSDNDGFPTTARTGGPALAVISYAFWQRELGGSPAAIGQNIRVGKLAYNVVAVARANFRGIDEVAPDVWVPITVALEAENPMRMLGARDGAFLQLIGRVAKGASRSTVEAQSTAIYRATDAINRLKDDTRPQPDAIAASIVPGRGPDAPREIKITLWLGGVSALVLLIVCANVANLLLSRAFTRRREIAVRLALGAGRGRLARQLLAEALLLSAIGGVCGLYLAAFGGRVMQQWLQVRTTDNAWIDVRLVLFTLAVTIGTGVLVSLVPMLQSTSPNLGNGLRASTSNGGRGISARTVLLATQAALCVVMLVGAGLFAQSLRRVQQLDLGVDLDHTLQISMFGAYYMNVPITEANAMFAEIKRQVDALPGVRRSAYSSSVFGGGRAVAIHTTDKSFDEIFPRGSWNEAMYEASVDSGMFQTLGVTSLRGRDFNSTDRRGEQRVTILNLPLAKRLFPNGDALGQCVVMPVWQSAAARTECVRVIGVLTGYYRRSLVDRDGMVAFIPLAQQTVREPAYVLYASTVGDADLMAASVRKIVRGVRPDLRRLDIKSMRAAIEPQMRPWNLAASMFVLFGAVALLVASIGMYAVVSFSVAQRTTEIAVRLALGARTHHIGATVGRESLYAVISGLVAGVFIALILRNSIGALLFQTSPGDPFIFGGVMLLLFVVATVAMIVPLVRALRVNPSEVMRQA